MQSSCFSTRPDIMSTFEKIMTPCNRLFYLALPPSVFKPVTTMLKVRKDNADKEDFKTSKLCIKPWTKGG